METQNLRLVCLYKFTALVFVLKNLKKLHELCTFSPSLKKVASKIVSKTLTNTCSFFYLSQLR